MVAEEKQDFFEAVRSHRSLGRLGLGTRLLRSRVAEFRVRPTAAALPSSSCCRRVRAVIFRECEVRSDCVV